MSWSSPMRVLGVCGVWLAIQTGCGGNPSVSNNDPGTNGGSTSGSGGNPSTAGTGPIIHTGGQDDNAGGEGDTPAKYVCGNGALEPGEFCDDGNTAADDGCSGDCTTIDPDYDCSAVGETCEKVVICGDGTLQGAEACDDGNIADDDGCSGDCSTVEDGWACVRPGQPCVPVSVCGNGVRERGEECDDGQMPPAANDGCDAQCQRESGYYCPIPGSACVQQVCGDGVRTPEEDCDDHNTTANDGCSATCELEAGWHCNSMGCKPECGDGLKRGTEQCDDNNVIGGDGCSTGCKVEPFFTCNQNSPSTCTTSIECGNFVVDPGEACDENPKGSNGCEADCSPSPTTSAPAVCGNSLIEDTEKCDPPGNGCSAQCTVVNGWTCPQAGVCFENPRCGDNIVQPGEGCDPQDVGNGCSATCQVENGWTCVGLGPSTCVKPLCGNGLIEPGEKCDDGNAVTTDGCNGCAITTGWACPAQGVPCLAKCGDGLKVGIEQCDDANKASGDGCNTGCKVEVGFSCPTVGAKCVASVCGDKNVDAGEGCDDGGLCFGGTNAGVTCTKDANCTGGGTCKTVAGDGCGPTCQPEPTVTVGPAPTVNVFCGDGLKTGTEVCDDGNTTDGDGCQGDCKSETSGWDCTGKLTLPPSLQMRVTYRDFKQRGSTGGHPDFEHDNSPSSSLNITGPACKLGDTQCLAAAGDTCPAGTCSWLDAQGKPAFHQADGTAEVTNENTFSLWYRDTNPTAIAGDHGAIEISKVTSSLTLNQVGGAASEVYEYESADFFPLTGIGFGNDGNAKNFHFTTELRYFFQYKGGEKLTFRGDDDVWVYINGRLAVDVGGVHCAQLGQVVLGDEDSSCTLHQADYTDNNPGGNFNIDECATTGDPPACALTAGEQGDTIDDRFGLTKGGVYEIVLFHAERHTSQSNFRLTLSGFLAPRSSCGTFCGDHVIAGDEFCDDGDVDHGNGNSDSASGACNTSCTARAYCGDGTKQLPGEACDNGTNTDLYKTAASPATVCAPGCKVPASCGDGALQAGQGEQCDKGNQNNDASYGPTSCTTQCKLGGYCGDNIAQLTNGEACDLGSMNGKTYGATSCGYDCQPGARCGDHIRNGTEKCDDGDMNGAITSHCSTSCTIVPYCGDGIKQNNEECDYGLFASTEYGGCTDMCLFGPKCGDGGPGNTPDPEEECDYGSVANTGGYDGCTNKCALGPHCGDGIKNGTEFCDNGFNADEYDDPNTVEVECGKNCTQVPYCGDGIKNGTELCDYGTENDPNNPNAPAFNSDTKYNGCNLKCEFGPYCGDSHTDDPDEACDNGLDNVSWAAEEGACSYDCQKAPWCGDGTRNGPEQCDLGAGKNDGSYGTCNADCTFAPRCGDGVKQGSEQCDAGPTGSLTCTPTCKRRDIVQ